MVTDDPRSGLRVVVGESAHHSRVVALARELWSRDPALNAAYLEWKYLRNPYIGEPLLYLAFDGESLIGMRGVFGSRWETGGGCFTLPYADDLVIAPSHRGRWVHQRIMAAALQDLADRGYRHIVNLSASRATAVGSLKMRWRSCGGMRPMRRRTRRKTLVDRLEHRLRNLAFVWRWADRAPALGLPPEQVLFERLGQRLAGAQVAGLVVERQPRAAAMAELVRQLPYDGRIRHLRDETYIDWRYANPLREYLFLYAGGRETLDGYLVLQRSLGIDHGRVSIVDWEARDERVRDELFAAVIAGGFPELYAWARAGSPAAAQLLANSGFEPASAEYEKTILVRPVRDADLKAPCLLGGRHLDKGDDWDLRMIYSLAG